MASRVEKNKSLKKEKLKEIRKEKKDKRRKLSLKVFLIFLVVLGLIFCYARFVEVNLLDVKEYKLENELVPDNFDGLKLLQFSDLHYGMTINNKNIDKIVKKINSIKPDIVVFTGDLVDQDYSLTKEDINILTEALKKIEAKYGKYSVKGNHDYYNKDFDNIMYDASFMNLKNTYDTVYNDNSNPLLVYGFDDTLYGNPSSEGLNDKGIKDIKYKIVLVHEADYVDDILKEQDVQLVLSGHSHGGQVRIPCLKPFFLPDGSKKYYDSYYKVKDTDVYVSNGIGTSIFKMRFGSTPIINFFRLKK